MTFMPKALGRMVLVRRTERAKMYAPGVNHVLVFMPEGHPVEDEAVRVVVSVTPEVFEASRVGQVVNVEWSEA